jgi:ferredoxin--NADP+ reductase
MVGIDDTDLSRGVRHNLEIFREWTTRVPTTAPRRLHLHLGATPARVLGEDRVEGLRVSHVAGGSLDIPAQLIFRSVGNLGLGLPGVPLEESTGTIPTVDHRVVGGTVEPGEYAAGWIKRGAVGVIGTNRSDATETVQTLLADADVLLARDIRPGSAADLLRSRGVAWVSLAGWSAIDAAEIVLGGNRDSPRVKLARWEELLKAGANRSD